MMRGTRGWILVLLAAVVAVGACQESRSGNALAARLGLSELHQVEIGMTARRLGRARPSTTPGGYGIYMDSLASFRVEYLFDGFAPREGARVRGGAPLLSYRIIPLEQDDAIGTWLQRLTAAIGAPVECFYMEEGQRARGVYRYWPSEEVLLIDRTSVRGSPDDPVREFVRQVSVRVGQSDELVQDVYTREPLDCATAPLSAIEPWVI